MGREYWMVEYRKKGGETHLEFVGDRKQDAEHRVIDLEAAGYTAKCWNLARGN